MNGITRVVLPIGVNAVQSVNCYVLADGDRVTVVDCGVWRPDLPDGGLAALTAGLNGAGYALGDVGRIVVTHAHIDHYGLAGKVMEETGAQLVMHAMTDLDCEKYRHPDTARARRRDTYEDHGVSEAERMDLADHLTRWLPYLHSVVEASTRLRGGERLEIGGDAWDVVHTPGHSLGHVCLHSPARGVLLSGDHLLPGITPPVTFERGFDADPLRSYLDSLRRVADLRPTHVLPGHGHPFDDPAGRIEAIYRTKLRQAGEGAPGHRGGAVVGGGAGRPARRQGHPRPPAPARDQRDALAHRLSAVVRRGRTAHPAGRRLRVVPDRRSH